MDKKEENLQKNANKNNKNVARKRSYSDHNMVKKAYRFNKKKLDELKDNKIIFGKDISQFINIIDDLSISLPKFLNCIKKYFSVLQFKIASLIQQINSAININIKINENHIINEEKEETDENDNDNVIDEELDFLFFNFNKICDFDNFIIQKRKELSKLLEETILKEINNKFNDFKMEKNKLIYKIQNIINDIFKIKQNIDLVIEKSKNIEDLDLQKNNMDDLKILQNFFSNFEKEYNIILSEIKTFNQNTLNFLYDDLNKYFEFVMKINEEIKEEINRIIIGNKNSLENENKFISDKIKLYNKKSQKDIKQYILLNNDNEINEQMKSKSLLSRIGDAMLIAPEYFIYFNSFDNIGEDDKSKKIKHEDDKYNKEDLITLKNAFSELKKKEIIKDELLSASSAILGNVSDKKQYLNLCLHFVTYISKNTNIENLKFNNIENFIFANNMLNLICQNCPYNKVEKNKSSDEFGVNYKYYQIIDKIISICNDFYFNDKYMCSLMKNNDIIKNNKIFRACFEVNLINEIKISLDNIQKNINPVQNVIDLFNNKINSPFQKFDFIKEIGLDKYIESYNSLTYNEKINFNCNELLKILHHSLKKYIIYMANYEVDNSILEKLVKDLNEYFLFFKENIFNFYMKYHKISMNSIKRYLFQSKSDNIKRLKKIKKIKENKVDINNNQGEQDIKMKLILKNALYYLDIKKKTKVILINKKFNRDLKTYYYKSILSSNKLPIEKRIKIWEIILKCDQLNKINYEELIKNFEEMEDYKVIMDDTKRTFLINKDKDICQKIVKNILCAFISNNNFNIRYCQGMNFIVAFLYNLTNDEKLSFILFKSLIENTKLKTIYDKKFELLHCYFYVLDRLISLFLPLLRQKFDEIQINIDCFVSAFFLTLFSNVFILNNKCEKFMIFTFERFALGGWKIIFKSILSILKYNENEIINIKEESEILKYVIQDMKKSDIFLNENFEKFLKIYHNYDINDDMINDIVEEYKSENELMSEYKIK